MTEQGCAHAHISYLYDYHAQPRVAVQQNLFVPQPRWPKTKVQDVPFAGCVVLVRPPQKALRKEMHRIRRSCVSRNAFSLWSHLKGHRCRPCMSSAKPRNPIRGDQYEEPGGLMLCLHETDAAAPPKKREWQNGTPALMEGLKEKEKWGLFKFVYAFIGALFGLWLRSS